MGVSFFPSPNYAQRRAQLAPQIVQQAAMLIRLYYEAHELIKEQYALLPKHVISLVKQQPLSKKDIKERYKRYLAAFGKYTMPLVSDKALNTLPIPVIPGLLHFYQINDYPYCYPFKKPHIHLLPVFPYEKIAIEIENFEEQEYDIGTKNYAFPLKRFNCQYVYPRLNNILRAQYKLQKLYQQYDKTYPNNTDANINELISKAYTRFHRQRATNNALYFVTSPIHWPIQKVAQLALYILEQHWVACLVAILAVLAGAMMLAFGYPPPLTPLWNTFNISIILNPIVSGITSCLLYGITAFVATVVTFELFYLTNYKNKKMQQEAIKEAQAEINSIGINEGHSYNKILENTKSYIPKGCHKPNIHLPFSKPLNTWGERLTHYFSHKYEIVDDEANDFSLSS